MRQIIIAFTEKEIMTLLVTHSWKLQLAEHGRFQQRSICFKSHTCDQHGPPDRKCFPYLQNEELR